MNSYTVTIPVCGAITVLVEAENAEQAEERAFDCASDLHIPSGQHSDHGEVEDFDWEPMTKIVQGNVFYGHLNKVEIEEHEEE